MGYLELILGPMFSGKSSRLIQIIRKYKILNHSILVIKPVIDKRYSENSEIVTHDKISEKCVTCSTLSEIKDVDKFMILASDGVWEFISNDQAVNIVMPHY